MSMVLEIRKVRDEVVDQLLSNPEDIEAFLFPDETAEISATPPKWQFWKKTTPAKAVIEQTPESDLLYLDKAWHGIHFVLTGLAEGGNFPQAFLFSGQRVGDIDVGYGPAMSLRSTEVAQAADFLSKIDFDELARQRSEAEFRAAEIYPFYDESLEDALPYLGEYFEDLRRFVMDAAKEGRGFIVSLT